MNNIPLKPSWKNILADHISSSLFIDLMKFIDTEYENHTIYPKRDSIFTALNMTPWEQVRVVILGQDPYHNPGQAHGLAFSVPDNITLPPSLRNIYKEITDDMGTDMFVRSGDLSAWAQQGVLLLNSVLTVRENQPASHTKRGWEKFTDHIIQILSHEKDGLVFMLWGSYAQKKGAHIDREKHLVLAAPHPSPLSAYRGFFGCKHFSQANNYLEKQGKKVIDW